MVSRLNQPPSDVDFVTILGSQNTPEGVHLYAQAALTLTATQADDLSLLAQQAEKFQNWSGGLYNPIAIEQKHKQLYQRLEVFAKARDMTAPQLLEAVGKGNQSLSSALVQLTTLIEIECRCKLWVWKQRDAINAAMAQIKEGRILALMQDGLTTRASDDLNRALYRTLAELRKQQDWRLHISVQDITPLPP
jgi:hypothetical protein